MATEILRNVVPIEETDEEEADRLQKMEEDFHKPMKSMDRDRHFSDRKSEIAETVLTEERIM